MEDERGPGLEFLFVFCVRQSSVRGCRFSFVFVYFVIKVLDVRRFPPPSSRTYQLHYKLHVYTVYIYSIYTILQKVLGHSILMNRFDYFSYFQEYKS